MHRRVTRANDNTGAGDSTVGSKSAAPDDHHPDDAHLDDNDDHRAAGDF